MWQLIAPTAKVLRAHEKMSGGGERSKEKVSKESNHGRWRLQPFGKQITVVISHTVHNHTQRSGITQRTGYEEGWLGTNAEVPIKRKCSRRIETKINFPLNSNFKAQYCDLEYIIQLKYSQKSTIRIKNCFLLKWKIYQN